MPSLCRDSHLKCAHRLRLGCFIGRAGCRCLCWAESRSNKDNKGAAPATQRTNEQLPLWATLERQNRRQSAKIKRTDKETTKGGCAVTNSALSQVMLLTISTIKQWQLHQSPRTGFECIDDCRCVAPCFTRNISAVPIGDGSLGVVQMVGG